MGKVVVNITMSLDGFVAGPNITNQQPLGAEGERLHDWMFGAKTDLDAKVLNQVVESSGAVIVGGHTYATAIETGWGGQSPFIVPAFVLTNKVPAKAVDGFTYVTDGIESALAQARSAAGDKNIWIMGGANIVQQYIKAGLVDELQIHIASILLAQGTRLFEHIGTTPIELECQEVITTPAATYFQYRVVK